MSLKWFNNIDLQQNELQNGVIQNLTSDPSNGKAGQIYYNTADKGYRYHNGTEWVGITADAVKSIIAGNGLTSSGTDTVTISLGTPSASGSGSNTYGSNGTTANSHTHEISLPDASDSTKGVIEIATDAEASAGTDTTRAINAKQLAAATQEAIDSAKVTIQTSNGITGGSTTPGNSFTLSGVDASTTAKGVVQLATDSDTTSTDKAVTPKQLETARKNASVTLNAGNGLTGGGTGNNVTVTLGTPSTITQSTINSVTSTSHTHGLSFTAVSSPSASGNEISFIDTVSQGVTGGISATKKTVRNASTTQTGVVELATQDEVNTGSDTTRVVTPVTLGKGKASGVASLGSDGKILSTQLPDLATVAFTGSYNDLTDKPTVPGVPDVVQTTGQSTTAVMSQKAVTDELNKKASKAAAETISGVWSFTTAPKMDTLENSKGNAMYHFNGERAFFGQTSFPITLRGSLARPQYTTDGETFKDLALASDVPTNYVTTDTEQGITGKKWFINNSGTSTVIQSSTIDLNTPPTSATQFNYIDFIDKTGQNRFGVIGSSFDKSGYAGTYMQARNTASIGIKATASGNVYTWSYTPPVNDNSNQIATTEWVRNFAYPNYLRGVDSNVNYQGYYKIAEATLNEWYRCSVARIFIQDVDSSENGVLNVSVYAGGSTIDGVLTSVTTANMGFLEGVNPNAYFGRFFAVVRKKSSTVRGTMKVELWYCQPNTWGRISFSFLTDIPDSRAVSVANKWTKFTRTSVEEQGYVKANVVDLDNGFIPYDSFNESAFVTDDYPIAEIYDNSTNQAQFTAGALRIANSQYAKNDTPTTSSGREVYFTDKNNSQLARVQAVIGSNWNALNLILENKNKVARAIEYMHDSDADVWNFRPTVNDIVNLGTASRRWNNACFKAAHADSITLSTTDSINFAGTQETRPMIRFVDNADNKNGMGVMVGNGGVVLLGSGESATNLKNALGFAGEQEQTYVASDNNIKLFSNCNTIANRKELTFNNSGQLVYTPTAGGTAYTYTLPTKTGTLAQTSDIGNGTLTIQKNGTNVATFSANQSSDVDVNIDVPEALSELTDDINVVTNNAKGDSSLAIGMSTASAKRCVSIGVLSGTQYDASIRIGCSIGLTPTDQSVTQIGTNQYTSSGRALYLGAGSVGFTYMNSAGASWTSASDIRDKTDIQNIDHALDFIKKLKPITYVMNDRERYLIKDEEDNPILDENGKQQYDVEAHKRGDKKKHRRFAGLSAQDTYQAMLDCYDNDTNYAQIVDNNKFDHPDDEYLEQYSMSYERLVPFLIKAIQEQQEQIEQLKSKLGE